MEVRVFHLVEPVSSPCEAPHQLTSACQMRVGTRPLRMAWAWAWHPAGLASRLPRTTLGSAALTLPFLTLPWVPLGLRSAFSVMPGQCDF